MIEIWELYKSGIWVEPFLILSIGLFMVVSVILYLLIIKSRNRNIKKERLRLEYGIIIEKIMFSIVFQDSTFKAITEDTDYIRLSKTTFFREVIIESIINLHKNYHGIYAQRLEQFYSESQLIKDSFKKLKSIKWEVKCKGIKELSEMNVNNALEKIVKISNSRNKTLKITAINACIRLSGTDGIVHLTEHQYPIDDWTQINIISAFKKYDIGDTKGVELLLESQNTTVIALGLKIIKELKLTQKISYVERLSANAPNPLIQYEAKSVVQELML